jgi:hypothetical protein
VDTLWITVENRRKSGDSLLGISKALIKGFRVSLFFPQSSPQRNNFSFSLLSLLVWEKICNYKKVILITHISTAAITTNFINKTFSWRVRPIAKKATV